MTYINVLPVYIGFSILHNPLLKDCTIYKCCCGSARLVEVSIQISPLWMQAIPIQAVKPVLAGFMIKLI